MGRESDRYQQLFRELGARLSLDRITAQGFENDDDLTSKERLEREAEQWIARLCADPSYAGRYAIYGMGGRILGPYRDLAAAHAAAGQLPPRSWIILDLRRNRSEIF